MRKKKQRKTIQYIGRILVPCNSDLQTVYFFTELAKNIGKTRTSADVQIHMDYAECRNFYHTPFPMKHVPMCMYASKYSTGMSSMLFFNLSSKENSTHHLFWRATNEQKSISFMLCKRKKFNYAKRGTKP